MKNCTKKGGGNGYFPEIGKKYACFSLINLKNTKLQKIRV